MTTELDRLRALADDQAEEISNLRAELSCALEDKRIVEWLEANPHMTQIQGGSDDGHTGRFWGLGAASGTLREAMRTIFRIEGGKK